MSKLHDYINKFYSDINSQVIKLGLDRVGRVKDSVNIEPKFPIITIGGTNGKGSVCAFLETIYSKAGYSVGCYTSPHLFKFNERIEIRLNRKLTNGRSRLNCTAKDKSSNWRWFGHQFYLWIINRISKQIKLI